MKKVWYKVFSNSGMQFNFSSLEDLIDDIQLFSHHKILKIIEVTEKPLSKKVIDEINSKIEV